MNSRTAPLQKFDESRGMDGDVLPTGRRSNKMTVTVTFTDEMISPDIVRDLRESLGMTQAELADEAKVSKAEIKAYEDGEPTKFVLIHEIGSALKRRGAKFRKPR
jgi:DNA-binding XRE family transcriptional regulator